MPITLEVVNLPNRRTNTRLLVRSAAAMYAGAGMLGFVEGLIPGGRPSRSCRASRRSPSPR